MTSRPVPSLRSMASKSSPGRVRREDSVRLCEPPALPVVAMPSLRAV
ncbi:Uncharacterised protein [Bordetella pertussis]|nr:Uncharacterised protein [Bordetella pertussis]